MSLPNKSRGSKPKICKKQPNKERISANIKLRLLPLFIRIPPISEPRIHPTGRTLEIKAILVTSTSSDQS